VKQVKSFKNKYQAELIQYDKRINVESIFSIWFLCSRGTKHYDDFKCK